MEIEELKELARQAGDEGNTKQEVELYMKAAELGDAHSQYMVGLAFCPLTAGDENDEEERESFYGFKSDGAKSTYWFKKAAEQGHKDAQAWYGHNLYFGLGVASNVNEAFKWWEKSAEAGCATGQFYLGHAYSQGFSVKKDFEKAKYWFEKAAKQNHDKALFCLGSLYLDGVGCTQNFSKAYEYINKSADLGCDGAIEFLKEHGDELQEAIRGETAKGGCYVATSVYGSYDCPQVWTLRRYRDYSLAKTWHGRLFIKVYYAISPTLVKWFGNKKWFKNFWLKKLNKFVYKLQQEGYSDSPYND